MKRAILAVVVFASAIQAQQQNPQTPNQQHAEMMKRGDTGMGFSQEKTTHHFFLLKDGGVIQVSANDPKDDASRNYIRMHLSHVATMFSQGNFNVPMFIHDTTPPGVATVERLHNEIHYRYEQTDAGAKIVIDTAQPKGAKGSPPSSCVSRFVSTRRETQPKSQMTAVAITTDRGHR